MASDKRRGHVEGVLQLRRAFQRGECLPARKSWAEQLSVCAAKRECAPAGVEPPQSTAPAEEEVAAKDFGYLDFAWEAADVDDCDVGEAADLVVTSD